METGLQVKIKEHWMKKRIQIISDLHWSYYTGLTPDQQPVGTESLPARLVVAGDYMDIYKETENKGDIG